MNPNIDDRLASVIRALSDVILPHLPADASLAQEQAQLAIGHLQILRAQLDQAPDFEREELADFSAMAVALKDVANGGDATKSACQAIEAALANDAGLDVREQRVAVNRAIEQLIHAVSEDGAPGVAQSVAEIVLEQEEARSLKDRRWFAPFGFDTLPPDQA